MAILTYYPLNATVVVTLLFLYLKNSHLSFARFNDTVTFSWPRVVLFVSFCEWVGTRPTTGSVSRTICSFLFMLPCCYTFPSTTFISGISWVGYVGISICFPVSLIPVIHLRSLRHWLLLRNETEKQSQRGWNIPLCVKETDWLEKAVH